MRLVFDAHSHFRRFLFERYCRPPSQSLVYYGRTDGFNNSLKKSLQTRHLKTAACLIIGDEVLNGKIRDANAYTFARFCFEAGIDLKRIEIVGDDEDEIGEAAQRFARNYDFVVTSGGIGPTHDDITYRSIAKAFNVPVVLHQDTVDRMSKLRKIREPSNGEAYKAQMRMAELPKGCNVTYPLDTSWVPVACVSGKIYIFPGIPQLFNGLLNGLRAKILSQIPTCQRQHRLLVATKKSESEIAPYLAELQSKVKDQNIKIGSYPHMSAGVNTVSIIGKEEFIHLMRTLVIDIENHLQGQEISMESEAKLSSM
ncbi:MoaB/Mog domain-containing protein [Lipomyces japonicus]|uniref:MoaB/Mog domain-containing protein n=1 Tax=Lipomyces japonicus TaxID=56871 RepID=UPI0034CFE314